MNSSPDSRDDAGGTAEPGLNLLAVTACPTGIAHTYMAAEKLSQAAEARGIGIKVETQGSIGAENVLTDNDVRSADGIVIAADTEVDRSRFAGKRVLVVGVSEGISDPDGLIDRVQHAPVVKSSSDDATAMAGAVTAGAAPGREAGGSGGSVPAGSGRGSADAPEGDGADRRSGSKERSLGYKALMNGVSYMIPFVVVGGLLMAVSLALGGTAEADGGLVIPDGSVWKHLHDIGDIGFQLMVPALSGYIAFAIADRPALAPAMIGGWIANNGELYDSEAGAGFIGAIVTGFLAGFLVRWIKKVPVPTFVQPIMPIIVIPVLATSALGLFFIYVIGRPISWVFESLTDFLGSMTGTSAALLGIVLGLMISFDMGGPVNKTAFLFGTGLVSKNPEVMGMCAAAIPVPPLGQGLATLLRRRYFSGQERETGYAALFMGFFGITEGAIPFAAARPARVIPANMLGGAVAGSLAGLATVQDNVPHGGPIVAVLGAVDGVAMFFLAIVVGTAVTGLATVGLMSLGSRRADDGSSQGAGSAGGRTAVEGAAHAAADPSGVVPATSEGSERMSDADRPVAVGTPSADVSPVSSTGQDQESTSARIGGPNDWSTSDAHANEGEVSDSSGKIPSIPSPTSGSSAESAGADVRSHTADGSPTALSGYLDAQSVKVRLESVGSSTGKEAAIREMAQLLAATGKVTDLEGLIEAALAREAQGTTGLGEEIAVPHAKTEAVTSPVVGFARAPEGVDWGAVDGTAAKLIFMIAVPAEAAGDEHLRLLALLSRKLMDGEFRQRLLAADSRDELLKVLAEIE